MSAGQLPAVRGVEIQPKSYEVPRERSIFFSLDFKITKGELHEQKRIETHFHGHRGN